MMPVSPGAASPVAIFDARRVKRRPRAVIFDWDNTLIDSWHAIHDAQNHTLQAFGLDPWTMDETRVRVRLSMRDSYPLLFGDRWREAGDVFYQRFEAKHMETLTALEGAEELLIALHEQEVYLAVVSNKKGSYLRDEAGQLGWDRFFGRIVGAFDASRDKPSADPVHMALELAPVPPGDDVWFVGDADIDMECATNAGCVPVLIREIPPKTGELSRHPPALYVNGCKTLSNLIMNL